jgi:tetraacyldisaccharide 4'-kinase
MYAAGILRTIEPALPAISVGNLTVGGTGKTPFASWLASRLARDAKPAIVLRGYGGDETEVHRRLNPSMPVVAAADRVSAIADAKRAGADLVVMDDAYQHLRVRRRLDIVLVSAEQLMRARRLLPAGPWREPLESARRAQLIVVTRKSATDSEVRAGLEALRTAAPSIPIATVRLSPAELISAGSGERRTLAALESQSVLAIVAIGEPTAFVSQLEAAGARVTLRAFRDHHAFSDAEVLALSAEARRHGLAVCTLKDAVKLGGRWPAAIGLWYVSQQLVVEQGATDLDRVLDRVLAARASATTPAR